jgi:predicted nucleic acid-binding protein
VKYLADTNVLSEIRKPNGDAGVKTFIDSLAEESIFISVLSIGEIAYGMEKLPAGKRKNEFDVWLNHSLPERFGSRILSLDQEILLEWGKLRAAAGRTLPVIDSLFAATALVRRLIILTRNVGDFPPIPGLSLVNPWEPV